MRESVRAVGLLLSHGADSSVQDNEGSTPATRAMDIPTLSLLFPEMVTWGSCLEMLQEAIALAVRFHAGQCRDGDIQGCRVPYIVHPIDVMRTVWAWGAGDPGTLTAAVLHDALEDTSLGFSELELMLRRNPTRVVRDFMLAFEKVGAKAAFTEAEYLRRFGDGIAAIVKELTFEAETGVSKAEYLERFTDASVPARSRQTRRPFLQR